MRLTRERLLVVLAFSVTASCAMIDHFTGEDVNKQVRENGISATAEVLEIWDTGTRLNDDPVVGFRLRVTVGDGEPYEAETKNVISIVHIPQVQPGAFLPVKVDPEDRQRVALDIYEDQ